MAVAPEVVEETLAARAASRASAHVGTVARALPRGGQSGGAGIGIRLIWAGALGLLALEVLSLATNRYWSWSLKGGLANLKSAGTYVGLYPGQTEKLASASVAPSTALSAFGVLGPPDRNTGVQQAPQPGTPGLKPNPGSGGI